MPIWQAPNSASVTINRIDVGIVGGTGLTFNIEERASGSLNSAGTDVISADKEADQNGETITTETTPNCSNAGTISASSHLVFTTGASAASGTVNYMTGTIYYTVN